MIGLKVSPDVSHLTLYNVILSHRCNHLLAFLLYPSSSLLFPEMTSNQPIPTKDNAVYTTSNGAPVNEPYAAQRVGPIGPLLLQGMYNVVILLCVLTFCLQISTILIC